MNWIGEWTNLSAMWVLFKDCHGGSEVRLTATVVASVECRSHLLQLLDKGTTQDVKDLPIAVGKSTRRKRETW